MVYFDQSYLPITFLSPPSLDFSLPPDTQVFPSAFIFLQKLYFIFAYVCVYDCVRVWAWE